MKNTNIIASELELKTDHTHLVETYTLAQNS